MTASGEQRTRSVRTVHQGLLWLVILLAFVLRLVPFQDAHFWDEAVLLQNAAVIHEGRTNYDEFHYRPPLLPIAFAGGFAIWDHLYVAQLVEAVLTTLVVIFGYLYARRVWDGGSALIAASLFAFTPYFVELSHQLMTGMPAVALMLASMYLFSKPGRGFAFLSGVALGLAVQMRFTALFLGGYFLLLLALEPRRWREFGYLVLGAVLTIAPYLGWAQYE